MTGLQVAGNGHQPGFGLEAPTSAFEISGTVKWFSATKGFGFIVPDNGLPDVLLHVTCLQQGGFQTAYEGARIVCEALYRPKDCKRSASSPWMIPEQFGRRRPCCPRESR